MNWLRKHGDSVGVIVAVASGTWFMTHQIHNLEGRVNEKFDKVHEKIASLDKDIAVIKAIIFMQNKDLKEISCVEKADE